jgi:hypothetical protein
MLRYWMRVCLVDPEDGGNTFPGNAIKLLPILFLGTAVRALNLTYVVTLRAFCVNLRNVSYFGFDFLRAHVITLSVLKYLAIYLNT